MTEDAGFSDGGPAPDEAAALAREFRAGAIGRREFLIRAAALGLTASSAGWLLAGTADAATAPRVLRPIVADDMANADPAFWPQQADLYVINIVNEGLISYKPGTWEVVNTLAQEFHQSPNHLVFYFKLKQGIPFHGGFGELTADDVKFSYERIAGLTKPNIHSPFQGDWATLDRVKVTGKYTGEIHLKSPFAPLMRTTLPLTSGYIVSRAAVEKLGKTYGTHPIGTGPYEFTEWKPKSHITLSRFQDYGGAATPYLGRPAWDQIVMPIIRDETAISIALESHGADFGQIATHDVDRFAKDHRFRVVTRTQLSYDWLAVNVQHPVLSNLDVRKAIRYAINVPDVIQAAYDGKATRAYAILPKAMGVGYWPTAPRYNQDIAKAKSYLEKSGFSGDDLQFDLTCYDDQSYRNASLVMQAGLNQAGFKVAVKPQAPADSANYAHGTAGLKAAQIHFTGFSSAPDPFFSMEWFMCNQIKVWNFMGWCNKEYDALLQQGNKEFDLKKRTAIYIKAQKLMDEAAHSVWIDYPAYYYASTATVRPVMRPDGLYPIHIAFRPA
jgi:peptide/nickel transport system substrate-binding protein